MAWAALLCSYRPDLLDYDAMVPGMANAFDNTDRAFKAAEQIGVAMFLDAEDVIECPDKKCIVTQLIQFHMVLSSMMPKGRRQDTDIGKESETMW